MPEPTTNDVQPPIAKRLGLVSTPTKPLCHYTSQLGLIGILRDKAMWATDAAYLNDSQEVVCAVNLAQKYFRNRKSKDLRFDMDMGKILKNTESLAGEVSVYVASFSEEPDLPSQGEGIVRKAPASPCACPPSAR